MRKRGFTLIELLMVVAILGVLALVAIPRITSSSADAKVNACKANLRLLSSQCEMFKLKSADGNTYPADQAALVSGNYLDAVITCTTAGTVSLSGGKAYCTVHNPEPAP